jgi:predicted transcriptional regulator
MEALWELGAWAPVHEVLARLSERAPEKPVLSYSTVKAVLLNLVEKGIVRKRDAAGRAKEYAPVHDRATFEREVIEAVVSPLLQKHRTPLLAHIVEELAEDPESFAEFERLVALRRAERSAEQA